jgi:hypothetical protein
MYVIYFICVNFCFILKTLQADRSAYELRLVELENRLDAFHRSIASRVQQNDTRRSQNAISSTSRLASDNARFAFMCLMHFIYWETLCVCAIFVVFHISCFCH